MFARTLVLCVFAGVAGCDDDEYDYGLVEVRSAVEGDWTGSFDLDGRAPTTHTLRLDSVPPNTQAQCENRALGEMHAVEGEPPRVWLAEPPTVGYRPPVVEVRQPELQFREPTVQNQPERFLRLLLLDLKTGAMTIGFVAARGASTSSFGMASLGDGTFVLFAARVTSPVKWDAYRFRVVPVHGLRREI